MSEIKNEWVKRNITDADKVADIVETYQSMGYEVKVEDYEADSCDSDCNTCMVETPDKFKVIYTRQQEDFDDELFGETE